MSCWGFPSGLVVKNPPANAGNMGSTLGQEDPLEEEMATRCSFLAWEMPWAEETGGLQPVAAAATKSLQSCPTLSDPIDGSPPGFPVPGILQARTPEWVAISFSNA